MYVARTHQKFDPPRAFALGPSFGPAQQIALRHDPARVGGPLNLRSSISRMASMIEASGGNVTEDTPFEGIAHLMERHQIKRVLVARDGQLVGIVTRANLYAELKIQPWAPVDLINVVVCNGVVHLSGTLLDERHRGAIRVAAERIPGISAIVDHLVCVGPVSGMGMPAFEEVTKAQRKAS